MVAAKQARARDRPPETLWPTTRPRRNFFLVAASEEVVVEADVREISTERAPTRIAVTTTGRADFEVADAVACRHAEVVDDEDLCFEFRRQGQRRFIVGGERLGR